MRHGAPLLVAAAAALLSTGCRSPGGEPQGAAPSASARAPAPGSVTAASAALSPGSRPPAGGASALWSHAYAGNGVKILAAASGPGGELVVAGSVSGTVDLGAGPVDTGGATNAFVLVLDGAGKPRWSRRFPGEGAQVATAVAVDAAGNVVVTGTLDRSADFGGGALRSAGMIDVFAVKLDPEGKHIWSKRFGDASEQEAGAVAVGPDGSVILAGSFEGTIDLGGGPLAAAGADDVFVARLDAGGKHLWSKRFGDAQAQHGRAVAVDASGQVVLAGDAQGSLDLAGAPAGGGPASPDATSLFLARFDPQGRPVAVHRFPAEPRSRVRPHALAVDRSGGAVVVGALRGVTDLGGGPLASAGSAQPDVFAVALDASGAHRWSRRFGDAALQEALAVALDPAGGAVIAGRFEGSLDLGGGPLASAGKDDAFVARFDARGAHLGSARFGDPDRQEATAVAVDRAGLALLAGNLGGTVDFGAGPLAGPAAFVVKLGALR